MLLVGTALMISDSQHLFIYSWPCYIFLQEKPLCENTLLTYFDYQPHGFCHPGALRASSSGSRGSWGARCVVQTLYPAGESWELWTPLPTALIGRQNAGGRVHGMGAPKLFLPVLMYFLSCPMCRIHSTDLDFSRDVLISV